MTEYEINKAVAEKLGYYQLEDYYNEHKRFFDPCNNIEQAWEIMLANDISITKDYDGTFLAFRAIWFSDGDMEYYKEDAVNNAKPLVAAMLLFLEINK